MRHGPEGAERLLLAAGVTVLGLLACETPAPTDPADRAEERAMVEATRGPKSPSESEAGAAAVPSLTDQELDRLLDALEEQLGKASLSNP